MFRLTSSLYSRWTIKIIPASQAAARESPTPVVFFSGIFFSSEAFSRGAGGGIAGSLSRSGYTVGLVDLSPIDIPSSVSLDDLINDLRTSLFSSLPAPPVAIASNHNAVLVQKYLESWPVAALLMLNPLSPKRPTYHANSLRKVEQPNVCSVLQLLSNDPVRLEPSPVPTRAIFSDLNSNLINPSDAHDTREVHGLEDEDFIEISECVDPSFNLTDGPLSEDIELHVIEFIKRY
jgi:hypothetical protein